ncbi:MAG: YebC/PmpR family DNA-binding transcriptional regulator, partial [Armatimonadetes bacterium]|nr:YebC/PmpR family DNA-binding transcriptional regulator [Armatimonadota bacterium]MDW8121806.1 YebC/PmpR family DNA-binding transcriptional regulator [Armatimonadota bacterium]
AENVERAIKRGTGEIEGAHYEEVLYEGYGPGGAAILVEAVTDNRNRTTSELRRLFQKHGGSLGQAGCVAWQFKKKAVFTIDAHQADEDTLTELALEIGAEDLQRRDSFYELVAEPRLFASVRQALAQRGITVQSSSIVNVPQSSVFVDGPDAKRLLALIKDLEDHDDVQTVSSNFDVPDAVLEESLAAV